VEILTFVNLSEGAQMAKSDYANIVARRLQATKMQKNASTNFKKIKNLSRKISIILPFQTSTHTL
jgi:hypothetical protein